MVANQLNTEKNQSIEDYVSTHPANGYLHW